MKHKVSLRPWRLCGKLLLKIKLRLEQIMAMRKQIFIFSVSFILIMFVLFPRPHAFAASVDDG